MSEPRFSHKIPIQSHDSTTAVAIPVTATDYSVDSRLSNFCSSSGSGLSPSRNSDFTPNSALPAEPANSQFPPSHPPTTQLQLAPADTASPHENFQWSDTTYSPPRLSHDLTIPGKFLHDR